MQLDAHRDLPGELAKRLVEMVQWGEKLMNVVK